MFRRVFLARLLLAALFGALLVPAQAQEKFSEPALSDPDSWTVVLLPDLQGYAKKACNQPIMEIMTSWIAAHAEALNTKLVLCVGDLVEQNDRISNGYSGDQSSHKQWEATARAFSQLDGVVPYMTATGNHDYTYTHTGDRRTHIGEYFPVDKNPLNRRMLSQYGLDAQGNHAVENAAFELRSPEGIDYLFLNLEFAPRDTVIGWARRIVGLEEYRNHRVVLMTHSYLNAESERIAGDPVRVTSYEPVVKNGKITKFKQELPDANQGEAIWRKLVYPASNIELVLCGHVSGWGFRTDANSAGRPVHQMLFDSQSMGGGYEGNGGDGWIRILEFLPDGRTVRVMTYSPLFALSPTTRQHAWPRRRATSSPSSSGSGNCGRHFEYSAPRNATPRPAARNSSRAGRRGSPVAGSAPERIAPSRHRSPCAALRSLRISAIFALAHATSGSMHANSDCARDVRLYSTRGGTSG